MKNILIIAFSDFENDPRVNRQVKYLRKFYNVSTVGWEPAKLEDVTFYEIKAIPRSRLGRIKRAFDYKLKRFEQLYWSIYDYQPVLNALLKKSFDLILVNDLDALPFGLRIANGAKVLLDTHDYAPRHFEDQWVWRFFFQDFNKYLCATYMKQCDEIITVSSGLAREYKKAYDIDPIIITNAVDYVDLEPTPVDGGNIRIITHGVAHPNRRLELMIKVMDHIAPRFHLDLMLLPVFPRYHKKLKAMASKRPNVRVIPPVSREEIVPFTNPYDLSFLVFKPYTINYRYGLFNKYFESLQARLMIVTGTSPEPQAEITAKYNCGVVVDSFEPPEIAARLNQLTVEEIEACKKQAGVAARQLTAAKNMELLGQIVSRLLGEAEESKEGRN